MPQIYVRAWLVVSFGHQFGSKIPPSNHGHNRQTRAMQQSWPGAMRVRPCRRRSQCTLRRASALEACASIGSPRRCQSTLSTRQTYQKKTPKSIKSKPRGDAKRECQLNRSVPCGASLSAGVAPRASSRDRERERAQMFLNMPVAPQ